MTSDIILVGVDGLESSRAALRWAVRRAAATGAQVSLVYVLDDEWTTIGVPMLEELRKDAQRLVEQEAEYARSLASAVSVQATVRQGGLMTELISASEHADLVAVGTHKTGYINGKIFGSRSLLLAAAAHTPVAVIPQTSHRDGRGIVVGVDDSPAGRAAIRFASNEAVRAGESLTLIRAVSVPALTLAADELHSALIQQAQARATELLSTSAALSSSVASAVDIRTRIIRRPAAEALVEASATATLLVIGDSREESAGTSRVGSVSHDVLINLSGPTIVVHAEDRF